MKKNDIAFLIYEPYKSKRKNNSFDGNGNAGANVIIDILAMSDINVDFCLPSGADKYRVILVSLTSTYDLYSFYQSVAMLPKWQKNKRKFKVVAGGFGMQNPTTVRNYVDYAVFGRAENFIYGIINTLLGGGIPEHESVMNLPDIHIVKMAQATTGLLDTKTYKEKFTGCPEMCAFCHYAWVRKRQGETNEYVQGDLTKGASPELLLKNLVKVDKKMGRVRTAIDGFSERLRAFGKKISNEDIKRGFEHIGSFNGNTVVVCYNIGSFPTETEEDRRELYGLLEDIKPKHRVIMVLHTTPFRPSLCTPMAFESVSLSPAWHKLKFKAIVDTPKFMVKHSMSNESPFSHLLSIVAERATADTDKLFHALNFASKLKNGKADKRLRIVKKNFNIDQYVKEYQYEDESFPGWFLSSFGNTKGRYKAMKKATKL